MKETTKEENKIIKDKLKKIHLDFDNIPDNFTIKSKIIYKPQKEYDTSYKVYKYIAIDDIDIYITKATRLDEPQKKYKNAKPILEFIEPNNEENIETYAEFLDMLKRLDLEELSEIEKEQKEFKNNMPYEVRYENNFIWDIYYSETEKKYFMMFPSEEENVTSLFYIIKKKIENKKNEMIYVPVSGVDFSFSLLKKTEIDDFENYLWYFTGEWPNIYEVSDKKQNKTLQIIGTMPIYEKVRGLYKITLNSKEEAQEQFKLIKALFILQSNMEQEYQFKEGLDDEGKINFYYNHNNITYKSLPEFIKNEIERKEKKVNSIIDQIAFEKETWMLLKDTIEKKNAEYLIKEKQIVTFLECKKTFFGRISYFFKKKKNVNIINDKKTEKQKETIEKYKIEEKKTYTIEDLLEVGVYLEEKEKEYKNLQMDIKALENKKKNLESKIKNATLYINEIESHKKSIFDFWKFTNKDEVTLLNEAESEKEESANQKLKKAFSYEEDIEDMGEKMDDIQRYSLNEKETDAIFAIYQDVETFNILRKEKILKKDDKEIEKRIKLLQKEYKEDYEKIKEKDFDIFGGVAEDKTKIKILKNNKHREIEKDKYRILNIDLDTSVEDYKDIILNYNKILDEIATKIKSPFDMPIYKIEDSEEEEKNWAIMDINPETEIKKINEEDETIILNRFNIKENMPIIFYTNIMFYNNKNKTLPLGMDLSTEVLIDLNRYERKLVSRKDVKINLLKNKFESVTKTIQVYEYELNLKEEK